MKNYYISGLSGWFVIRTTNKKRAKSFGVEEIGRGNVRVVREAKDHEVKSYLSSRRLKDLPEEY